MPPLKKSEKKEDETQPQEETVEVAVKEDETQPQEEQQDEQVNDLSPEEQEMAKKHGLISDKEDKTVIKVDDKNPSNPPAAKKPPAPQQPAPIDLEKRQEIKNVVDMELSLEEEKEVLKGYDANSKALYFRMKKNIKQRQAAESRAKELEAEKARLEEQLRTFKEQPKPVAKQQQDQDDDIFGDMDDDDVLTVSEMKARIAARKAAAQKQPIENNPNQPPAATQAPENEEVIRKQAEATFKTLAQQEEEFRASHEDFDDVLVNSKKIITMVNNAMSRNQDQSVIGELELEETFGSDRKTILQAKRLSVEFSSILAKGGIDEFGRTAAEVAYELGQLISVSPDTTPKGTETVGKAKIAKIIANSNKAKSSAAVTGSGTVRIPLSQLTAEDLLKMSSEEYAKVPKDVRDRILRNC
ncbi:MAG: hypothetical protein VB017_05510 [Endomicrobiaceae bacterium]|nr:hypothetical protein [Endomicrobiaceae bacterium]